MKARWSAAAALVCATLAASAGAAGDAARGAQAARACMSCHSFAPGQNMTGPSLADVWGRKAGTAKGFARYSDALKKSGIVWDEKHLDAWLANPQALVPGNAMGFPGIPDAKIRGDVLAYLEAVSSGGVKVAERGLPDLKKGDPNATVTAITHCGDAYRVTTADGKSETFWEFNLRLKTDSSARGPARGKPVLLGSGMQGDRASVVFAGVDEISPFVRAKCP